MNNDPLIWGKNPKQNIVSIEVNDDKAELFTQKEDGSISVDIVPNRFWMLSHKALDKHFVKLKGNQYYNYGRQFESWKEYSKLRNYYKDDVWGIWNRQEMLMVKDGYTYYKGMKQKEVSVLAFDIETTGLNLDINVKLLLISNTYRNHRGEIEKKLFAYDEYENEGQMLEAWCSWVRKKDPSVVIGHNIYSFDLPMLQHIADRYNIGLNLGRNNSDAFFSNRETRFRKDGSQFIGFKKVRIYGREIMDTLFLSYKYDVARNFESYGLKSIIKQLNMEQENRQFYDASQIRHKYLNKEEWKQIKAYCVDDATDSLNLYDLMIPAFFYMTQSIPKTFTDIGISASGSQINSMMIRSYLQEAHSIAKASEVENFLGAISIGVSGIYKNGFKVDIASLYPSIIDQYEVYDKYKDPNSNFLKMVRYFRNQRLEHKKLAKETKNKYYSDMEQMGKILVNSKYGFLGASGLNYNSPLNASYITEKGREILEKAIMFTTGQNLEYWKNKEHNEI